ncbi:AAA family ATPase [soil metagenome]
MRIEAIQLSWFRGAAEVARLEPSGRSLVLYGPNGSGKSSFVDGVEACIAGRLRHLAHEYSGTNQSLGIRNTHAPADGTAVASVEFVGNSSVSFLLPAKGKPTSKGALASAVRTWEYGRTILRQEEISGFIVASKGEKYSTLLPLLGLGGMEQSAENIRQLARHTVTTTGLESDRTKLESIKRTRIETFGVIDGAALAAELQGLADTYGVPVTGGAVEIQVLIDAVQSRIDGLTAQAKELSSLLELSQNGTLAWVREVRRLNSEVAQSASKDAVDRLAVLNAADTYAKTLDESQEHIQCPACGSRVAASAFNSHVASERARLLEMNELLSERRLAVGSLCDAIKAASTLLLRPDIAPWIAKLSSDLGAAANAIHRFDLTALRDGCSEDDLVAVENSLRDVLALAASSAEAAPPDVRVLIADLGKSKTLLAISGAAAIRARVAHSEALVQFLSALETQIRDEIRDQSEAIFKLISNDIMHYWAKLHPNALITGLRLYVPQDADKAIDIEICFHGVLQASPRITLSEGYRNSLGLCIFLAMAKAESNNDRPIILDDVVLSLDRDHRGMVGMLLDELSKDRQIILLTHDREWYIELQHILDSQRWSKKMLASFQGPLLGARLADNQGQLGDAKTLATTRPEAAVADARRFMDIATNALAENLHVRVPHRRPYRNDNRTAGELLPRVVAEAKNYFRCNIGGSYQSHDIADTLETANRRLAAWANRGTHTFDAAAAEAIVLIDALEAALAAFTCTGCNTPVWRNQVAGQDHWECNCHQLRWKR